MLFCLLLTFAAHAAADNLPIPDPPYPDAPTADSPPAGAATITTHMRADGYPSMRVEQPLESGVVVIDMSIDLGGEVPYHAGTTYRYPDGTEVEVRRLSSGLLTETRFPDGRKVVVEENVGPDGYAMQGAARTVSYDEQGRMKITRVHGPDGTLLQIRRRFYGEDGELERIETKYDDGRERVISFRSGRGAYLRETDSNGRVTREENYREDAQGEEDGEETTSQTNFGDALFGTSSGAAGIDTREISVAAGEQPAHDPPH